MLCDYLALCLSLIKILNLHTAIQPYVALLFSCCPHFIGQDMVSFWGQVTRLKPPNPWSSLDLLLNLRGGISSIQLKEWLGGRWQMWNKIISIILFSRTIVLALISSLGFVAKITGKLRICGSAVANLKMYLWQENDQSNWSDFSVLKKKKIIT